MRPPDFHLMERHVQTSAFTPPLGEPLQPHAPPLRGWSVFQALVLALTCHILSVFSTHLDHFSFSGSCFLAPHV